MSNERTNMLLLHINQKVSLLLAAVAFLVVLTVPTFVFAAADPSQQVDCGAVGLSLTPPADCSTAGGVDTLNSTITNVINTFSLIVGIVAVVMLIYGGFRYVTSGGDSGNIGNAKNTIMYAIVGLVIVAVSQAVVQFVLTKA